MRNSKKIKVLLKAPVLTQSGYGEHSREIFAALANNPVFDLSVESINWGHCSYLTDDTEERLQIRKYVEKRNIEKAREQNHYDLFIHVTIPDEFERLGTYCVGVTAGVETDRVSAKWIEKCEQMDMVIVPSEHAKKTLCETRYQWHNQQTNQQGTIALSKPVYVCPESVDVGVFRKLTTEEFTTQTKISSLKFESDFNFLCAGQWGNGGYGEDRKNISNTVRYFIESFLGRKDVGLVLKVNMGRASVSDYEACLTRLNQIKSNFKSDDVPPIYLVHGNLTDMEMSALYNHPQIKAFVSLTHGEGFGRHLLEAAACELPIIATGWSGQLDFLKKGLFSSVEFDLKEIPESVVWGDILIKGSQWAVARAEDAKARLQKMVTAYSKPQSWARELALSVKANFNLVKVVETFTNTVLRGLVSTAGEKLDPVEHLKGFIDTEDSYNVIYTMPMSAGDVYISTAVIDGLMKELPEGAKIYFATQPEYAGILLNNPNIHKVIPFSDFMINIDILEKVFDLALTPNVATQYVFSNWVRRGQGRLLAEEFANHCQCELGDYFIDKDLTALNKLLGSLPWKNSEAKTGEPASADLPNYITFHPGSGKDKWSARRYDDWQDVISNIKSLYPGLCIVQVGSADEPSYKDVDLDLRGKTNHQQLAAVISFSQMHLSIDTFTMHLAAGLNVPVVALFGCSYASSTGPWVKNKETAKYVLIESTRETGCKEKACYKNVCAVNPENPPINEIDSLMVVKACAKLLDGRQFIRNPDYVFKRSYGKISGYTTTYNLEGYPFVESIKSMLGFCDEVVVVDGCSTDGTYEILEKLAAEDSRVKLYQNPWDLEEPGMDGMQKAFARALCENEFLWQQDCDEVVHEDDYDKIKLLTKRFPKDVDIIHLPVVELWGNQDTVTARRHHWKWRLSRNKPEITHGINKHARLVDEKTGKTYSRPGASDGCEYINVTTNEFVPHKGFWNERFEMARIHMPEEYAEAMNRIFNQLPSPFHYSWCSLENKIKQFKTKWDHQWDILYMRPKTPRFPGVETDAQVKELAQKLYIQGGEDNDSTKYAFSLQRSNPAIMKDWLKKNPLNH